MAMPLPSAASRDRAAAGTSRCWWPIRPLHFIDACRSAGNVPTQDALTGAVTCCTTWSSPSFDMAASWWVRRNAGVLYGSNPRTIPLPGGAHARGRLRGHRASIVASEMAQHLVRRPAAIDRRLVSLARGKDGELRALLPPETEAVLLLEFEEGSPAAAAARARDLIEHLSKREHHCSWNSLATDLEEIDRIWRLRESILPGLYGLRGGSAPIAFAEDVGVPRSQLARFLREVQELLKRHQVVASFLVHAGTGQIHTRPFLDLQRPEQVTQLFQVGDAVHQLALELGGTVSTQHGVGLGGHPGSSVNTRPLRCLPQDQDCSTPNRS